MNSSFIAVDTESTISNKGNPYDSQNQLVCFSYATQDQSGAKLATTDNLSWLATLCNSYSGVVLFNAKFDLAWLRRRGCDLSGHRVFDLQLGFFLLSDQSIRYPSLNLVAEHYGIPGKHDVVYDEYWSKGINTTDIPHNILLPYAEQDARLTLHLFEKVRQELVKRGQWMLFSLQCQDIPVLLDMEWNGLLFDRKGAEQRQGELKQQQEQSLAELNKIYPDIPINFGSNDQLSAFLYGGTIKESRKEADGFYKSGQRMGQMKYKNVMYEHVLPRLFTPLKNSEMAKEGVFSTSDDTLQQLKGPKKKQEIVHQLRELAKLDKILTGYFEGYPKLIDEMNWENNIIHGTFNNVVARSGRLSAVKPNQQNMAPEIQKFIVSRYND